MRFFPPVKISQAQTPVSQKPGDNPAKKAPYKCPKIPQGKIFAHIGFGNPVLGIPKKNGRLKKPGNLYPLGNPYFWLKWEILNWQNPTPGPGKPFPGTPGARTNPSKKKVQTQYFPKRLPEPKSRPYNPIFLVGKNQTNKAGFKTPEKPLFGKSRGWIIWGICFFILPNFLPNVPIFIGLKKLSLPKKKKVLKIKFAFLPGKTQPTKAFT